MAQSGRYPAGKAADDAIGATIYLGDTHFYDAEQLYRLFCSGQSEVVIAVGITRRGNFGCGLVRCGMPSVPRFGERQLKPIKNRPSEKLGYRFERLLRAFLNSNKYVPAAIDQLCGTFRLSRLSL